jgi:uncharacterized protein YheU (UPF0270 family)
MKLTVDVLNNSTESAVINVGEDNGYVEAYIDGKELILNIYNQSGDLLYNDAISLKEMQT